MTVSAGRRAREPRLACRVRLADGRVFAGRLPAARHRAIHIGMLHADTGGFVELTPGTRAPGENVQVNRRHRREHFLPGGAAGARRWLERLLDHAERILDGAYARQRFADGVREEAFLGVTGRTAPRGEREYVSQSRWLWVDVDEQERLDGLYAFLAERPCHLLVASAGSGAGTHAYWRLDGPLAAVRIDTQTGKVTEPIERANARLIAHLGGDRRCQDRGRVMRLCGSPNHKRGEWARIVSADLALPSYPLYELVGDLPDPEAKPSPRRSTRTGAECGEDPVHQVPPPVYFAILAGVEVPPGGGLINCVNPAHTDRHPSMQVFADAGNGFVCWSCGVGGTAYDLHALVTGRPTGSALRNECFLQVKREVKERLGLDSGAVQ